MDDIVVTITVSRCTVSGKLNLEVVNYLKGMLSFFVEGYEWTDAYRTFTFAGERMWDGKKKLFRYNWKKEIGSCPSGLAIYVIKILEDFQLTFAIDDKRPQIQYTDNPLKLHGITPRDYQELGLNEFLRRMWIIWQAATGAGKTVMIAMAIARTNVSTMIYVHTFDLLDQMYDELTRMLQIPIGRIGGGKCDIQKINVCMIQTCHKVLGEKYVKYFSSEPDDNTDIVKTKLTIAKVIKNAVMIVFDECHHLRASTIQKIARASKSAVLRIGSSATSFRDQGDDLLIEAQLGAALFNVDASYLIRRNFLVQPKIKFLHIPLIRLSGRYQQVYKEYIVMNPVRNQMILNIARKLHKQGRKILIIVSYRDTHRQIIIDMIKPYMKVKFLLGLVNKPERRQILAQMKAGKLDCVIGTSLADEGLNLRIVSGLILAGGGKSRTKVFQRVGRALRTYDGKKDAVIYSFIDNAKYLRKHSFELIRLLKTEPEFKVFVPQKDVLTIQKYIRNKRKKVETIKDVYKFEEQEILLT